MATSSIHRFLLISSAYNMLDLVVAITEIASQEMSLGEDLLAVFMHMLALMFLIVQPDAAEHHYECILKELLTNKNIINLSKLL